MPTVISAGRPAIVVARPLGPPGGPGPAGPPGQGIDPDAAGTLAERAAHDSAPAGFVYLQTDVMPWQIWVKGSGTAGDWDGPMPITGTGNAVTYMTYAAAQAVSVSPAVQTILLAGYYVIGDGGRAHYKRVALMPSHLGRLRSADRLLPNGTTDALNGGWWELDEQVANVHMFGAKGDGTTDDTAAILAGDSYANTRKTVLEFFHRTYLTGPLAVGGGTGDATGSKAAIWRGVSYDGRGFTELTATLKLKNGSNDHLITVLLGSGQYVFERLNFQGNGANQTGTSFVVVLPPDPDGGTTHYHAAPWFYNCYLAEGRSGGLYVGVARANGRFIDSSVYYCGNATVRSYGVFYDSWDWVFTRSNFGLTINGHNFYANRCIGTHIQNCNFYHSTQASVVLSATCNHITFDGGSIDQNDQHGVEAYAHTGPEGGARVFTGVRFWGNGRTAAGSYSNVAVLDADKELVFEGCYFAGRSSGNNPYSHFRFFNAAARVTVAGCLFHNVPATNDNWQCLELKLFGSVTQYSATAAGYAFDTTATGQAVLISKVLGLSRWAVALKNADPETGANAGSNLQLYAYNDAGGYLNAPLSISRATGSTTLIGLQVGSASNVWGSGNMQISGTPYKPGGGPWIDSSDARIKDVVGPYDHGLAEIKQLDPVTYTFKNNVVLREQEQDQFVPTAHAQVVGKQFVGLIAQDAETPMPELVTLMDGWIDGTKVTDLRILDTNALTYALINAVKELAARLEALETP
jgi:hypothetical protein